MEWADLSTEERNLLVAVTIIGWDPDEQNATIPPRYTESLDAAWLVVEHMTHTTFLPYGLQNPHILFTDWWRDAGIVMLKRGEVADAICLAALYSLKVIKRVAWDYDYQYADWNIGDSIIWEHEKNVSRRLL